MYQMVLTCKNFNKINLHSSTDIKKFYWNENYAIKIIDVFNAEPTK